MIEVYQAEWCPYSKMVRERLGELGLPFVARPVAADREDREELRERFGGDTIPVVVLEDGTVLGGDTRETLAQLDERFEEPPGAEAHRRQLEAHGGL